MSTYTAFVGDELLAHGDLATVLRALAGAVHGQQPLVFRDADGAAVDFDLRGGALEELVRAASSPQEKPTRGRPKLGVIAREVSLLPRHWEWLEEQPNGLSAALRRLVEEAIKREPEKQRARKAAEATSRILSAIAGNRPGFEEVLRALFAGNEEAFLAGVKRWPPAIRNYAKRLAADAFVSSTAPSPASRTDA
jgi:hypothetical protein